ncbi:MAG: anaerobic glycerol-3-phosphate dehydrogenase subunit A [Euryarchaeota archaeon]|nr:anaerobic glycerol-3-phosphate dehydrogenase subunit A [Euryarchaeota archaeon]
MRKDVLIIGGGATGAGIARDLALRGVDCLLLDMGDFCHGASGGNHGLLHSGGRYVVKDPGSAAECAVENTVLKRIAPFCIEDTGGLFVSLPEDDPLFADRFKDACRSTGVPTEEIGAEEATSSEPGLNPLAVRCFRVPDGSVDPFSLVQANICDAREAGALALNHCAVTGMTVEDGRIVRVDVQDRRGRLSSPIVPEVVVNASGAWVADVAGLAACTARAGLDQGSMLVTYGRQCRHVINRLREPSNGDIAVPSHTSTVLGTTSRPARSPDDSAVTREDVDFLLRETSALLPSLRGCRIVRAYGGVRPLLGGNGREASRSFSITRGDAVDNLVSVAGGKLTTYRLMAEKVSDTVCDMLGNSSGCRTHLEALGPPADVEGGSIALARLRRKYGRMASSISTSDTRVICSCEQVLRSEVTAVLKTGDALTLADVMRRTRAGMGYCQGLDCTLSVLELMMQGAKMDPLLALREFLREREHGISQASGDQLRQGLLREHVLNGVYGMGEME